MKNLGFRKVLVNIGFLNPIFKDIHIFTKKQGGNGKTAKKNVKRNRIKFKMKNENGYYKIFKRNKAFKINDLCTKYLYKHLNGIYRQSFSS